MGSPGQTMRRLQREPGQKDTAIRQKDTTTARLDSTIDSLYCMTMTPSIPFITVQYQKVTHVKDLQ